MEKPMLVLDFDGVLHSYKSGWKGETVIPDPPTEGAQEFCRMAQEEFIVCIVTSRSKTPDGERAIYKWLEEWGFPEGIQVYKQKPPAFLTIDDRTLCFRGTWPDPRELRKFKSWVQE